MRETSRKWRREPVCQVDKHQRYRQRKREQKLCPHCGKDPGLYVECWNRRLYKRINYLLKRLAAMGHIEKIKPGLYRKLDLDAPVTGRGFYNTNPAGGLPLGLKRFLKTVDESWAKEALLGLEAEDKAWRKA